MRFGSVCSGIEAASVAWHPLGWQAAWLAEIEPFPSAVLAHHYPEVPNLGDMTTIAGRVLSREVEAPDVFCGGTPCQAFSVAGLRKSLADARGNLSLTFCEIANAIDDVRHAQDEPPCVVFWENVPGVLSTRDNAFGCFLGALAGCDSAIVPSGRWTDVGVVAGPQRAVAWRILDAQFFGLAQRRRRVFVVASAREGFDPAAVLLEWEGVRRDSAPSREAREGVAVCPTLRAGGNSTGGDRPPGTDVDTADSLQVVPALAACLTRGTGLRYDTDTDTDTILPVTHSLRGEGFDASEDGTGRGTPLVPVAVALRGRDGGATAEVGDDVAFTLRASDGGGDKPHVLAHAFDARQSDVIQYGDKTGPLDTDGHSVAVAFTQNSRSEVRHIGGDGQIVGALAADSGAQQQNYVATAVAVRTANTSANGHGISAELAHTLDQAQGQAVAVRDISPTITSNYGKQPDSNDTNAGPMLIPVAHAFHPTQDPISSPKHGDPCHPLVAGAHAPAIAFSSKDHGADATADLAPTLRAMPHHGSHANGGGQMSVALQDVRAVNKAQNGRGWNDEGVAYTIDTHATQGVAFDPYNQACAPVTHTLRKGRSATGDETPQTVTNMQVRRLTPVECERLQGFPPVAERLILNVCIDRQSGLVSVALQCLRWQSSVSPADGGGLTPYASTAEVDSSTPRADRAPLAVLHVLPRSGGDSAELRSHARSSSSANGANGFAWFLRSTLPDSSVRELAPVLRDLAHAARSGRVALLLHMRPSTAAPSGSALAQTCGDATEGDAGGAVNAPPTGTFTMSSLGQLRPTCDSHGATLCCSVLNAIAGCIPNETLPESFSLELTVVSQYTAIPWRGKPAAECPDGPRYKALGNSWATPVVRWIGRRIDSAVRRCT